MMFIKFSIWNLDKIHHLQGRNTVEGGEQAAKAVSWGGPGEPRPPLLS